MDPQPLIAPAEKTPERIGGWLILVAIGLVINPIRMLLLILKDIVPAFKPETWSVLTTPGSAVYDPMWAPLLVFELAGNIIFFALSIVVAIVFFRRKGFAPKLIIGFLLANLLFVLTDFFVADTIPLIAEEDSPQATMELIRSFVGSAIWVPYFFVSKRVKSTFLL